LTSIVIEDINNGFEKESLAFLYFSGSWKAKSTLLDVLSSLLAQRACSSGSIDLSKSVKREYDAAVVRSGPDH